MLRGFRFGAIKNQNRMTDLTNNDRVRRYMSRIEPAIEGSGGRTAAFKAALVPVKGFGLTPSEALPFMMEYNARCSPQFSEREVQRFLADAARSTKPDGYLLTEPPAQLVDEAEQRRRKRRLWPAVRPLTDREMLQVAALRHVSIEAVHQIHHLGFLWFGLLFGEECFVIRNGFNGTFAQRRRLDGQPCVKGDGSTIKALNLPGSTGSFLNPGGLGDADVPVFITEGAVSILEAVEVTIRADDHGSKKHPIAILAAVSASARFTAEHAAKLAGRRVRIYADADKAGMDAAASWSAALRAAGCAVTTIRPPSGCKDLGDALQQIPAGDSYWSTLLSF